MSKKSIISDSKTLKEIAEGQMLFSPALSISAISKFSDTVWSWENSNNFRLKCYGSGALKIDWHRFWSKLGLSENIILDLKKFAFFRFNYSRIVFPKTKRISHPATLVREITAVTSFLSHLCKEMTIKDICLVNWLTDVEVEDLRNCLASYPLSQHRCLKSVLRNLASETFLKYLGGRTIKWNEFDVQTLPWKSEQKKEYDRMPGELFSFLSNSATSDVKQFLKALEIEVRDKTPIGEEGNLFLQTFDDFKTSFAEYLIYREGSRKGCYKYWDKYRRKKGRIKEFNKIVSRAQQAAQVIIMLYTGARASELASFKLDCLRERDGGSFLVGTVIKNVDINAPIDQDEWIAIPIVCDAVKVLQQTAQIMETSHLFQTATFSTKGHDFVSNSVITNAVCTYIKTIDTEGKWARFRLRSHQFRNNLVFEMRKAELGLPFITHQLKHASVSLKKYSTSETTLLYGNLGSNAVRNAIVDANLVALREIYHPESPVMGGGAEKHKRCREAYFDGMARQGVGIDEELRRLALEGFMPLTDVGLGYCQGQVKIIVDGVKKDPPCIGALRCNPIRCGNAIIPLHKVPIWENVIEENRARANDSEFFYALPHLDEAIREGESVVQFFQIQGRRKDV